MCNHSNTLYIEPDRPSTCTILCILAHSVFEFDILIKASQWQAVYSDRLSLLYKLFLPFHSLLDLCMSLGNYILISFYITSLIELIEFYSTVSPGLIAYSAHLSIKSSIITYMLLLVNHFCIKYTFPQSGI